MKSFTLTSQFCISTQSNLTPIRPPSFLISIKNPTSTSQITKSPPKSKLLSKTRLFDSDKVKSVTPNRVQLLLSTKTKDYGKISRYVMVGAVSLGLVMFLMDQKALAFGPEGPLMEDFWDNMRRYGLYALTVSTGVLYAVFQPLYELLKNPISAILVLTVLGGGFYIVSQVVSAMIGVTDFSYDYNY